LKWWKPHNVHKSHRHRSGFPSPTQWKVKWLVKFELAFSFSSIYHINTIYRIIVVVLLPNNYAIGYIIELSYAFISQRIFSSKKKIWHLVFWKELYVVDQRFDGNCEWK
jgi:hypothetical protein